MGDSDSRITRIVADADVLAADLLVGGPAREALDLVRSHSWLTLYGSEPLVEEADTIIRRLTTSQLADDWREAIETVIEWVDHPPVDHPGIATAYRADAGHILSFDDGLRSAASSMAIRQRTPTSVKTPSGFVRLFDPEAVYEAVHEASYPGPDRDPRA